MLFEKLSEQEQKNIYSYIETYAVADNMNGGGRASLDYLLRYWDDNKEDLYQLLGENFIVEREVEFEEPISKIADKIDNGFYNNNAMKDFKNEWHNFLYAHENELGDAYYCLKRLIYSTALASNKYDDSSFTVVWNDTKVSVLTGCKPVKMLGKFVKLFGLNQEIFEKFRLAQSLYTNQRKVKGTLCLSIYPLDYMTMSDNENGWESCMNWRSLGCYCRGTVEMMNSKLVVVAYLKDENEALEWGYNEKHIWNSKKWRQLFVVDKDFITSVKAYPYVNKDMSYQVLHILAELAKTNWGVEFIDEPFDYEHRETKKYKDREVYVTMSCNTMYNDFGYATHYGIVSKARYEDMHTALDFKKNYSGPEICMYCGSTTSDFSSEGQLLCCDCAVERYCAECGESIYEDCEYELDGEYYCEYCYNDLARTDALTEEEHHCNNMRDVYFVPDEIVNEDGSIGDSVDLCNYPSVEVYYETVENNYRGWVQNCLSRYIADGQIRSFTRGRWGQKYYYIPVSQFTERTHYVFEYYGDEYGDTAELIEAVMETYRG